MPKEVILLPGFGVSVLHRPIVPRVLAPIVLGVKGQTFEAALLGGGSSRAPTLDYWGELIKPIYLQWCSPQLQEVVGKSVEVRGLQICNKLLVVLHSVWLVSEYIQLRPARRLLGSRRDNQTVKGQLIHLGDVLADVLGCRQMPAATAVNAVG